jgi:hypothetical protein
LSDVPMARRMGEAGYRRARELYNAERNIQCIMEVYQAI